LDDRLPDPVAIGRPRYRLDNQSGQTIAVVRIFEPGVWFDHRRRRKVGAQFGRVEEWPPVLPLAAIAAVANNTGAVREQLCDRCPRDRRMQPVDMVTNLIVEAELACFAKLHDASRRKALRMRGNAKTVARG